MNMKKKSLLIVAFLAVVMISSGQIKVNLSKPNNDILEDVGTPGAQCAVKKAHQLTDLEFVILDTLKANSKKTYFPNKQYKGVIYSFPQEISTFVGIDVSIHTYMTALNNPRSVVYTEHLDKLPYYSDRIASYYGTVCSGFVSYALGFKAFQTTFDIDEHDFMTYLRDQSAKGIQLADVLWQKGHVALITGIRRNKATGEIVWIEISEAWPSGARRRVVEGESAFNKMLKNGKWKIYRYNNLEENTYTPWTDFVAVEGEQRTPFQYNDAICPNKGDKSCYITGEDVILNIIDGYSTVEIYKDSKFYKRISIGNDLDIVLKDLPYGDYKARLTKGNDNSDYAFWKVIDVHVSVNNGEVAFHSENATPVYMEFCTISGSRPTWAWYIFTQKDVKNGYVKVSKRSLSRLDKKKSNMYVKVHFECDYGRVINKLVLWDK
jgi:hypothetical protein